MRSPDVIGGKPRRRSRDEGSHRIVLDKDVDVVVGVPILCGCVCEIKREINVR